MNEITSESVLPIISAPLSKVAPVEVKVLVFASYIAIVVESFLKVVSSGMSLSFISPPNSFSAKTATQK